MFSFPNLHLIIYEVFLSYLLRSLPKDFPWRIKRRTTSNTPLDAKIVFNLLYQLIIQYINCKWAYNTISWNARHHAIYRNAVQVTKAVGLQSYFWLRSCTGRKKTWQSKKVLGDVPGLIQHLTPWEKPFRPSSGKTFIFGSSSKGKITRILNA
jgi:hypothetical protein